MRKMVAQQPPLVTPPASHDHVRELQAMGAILDAHPELAEWVHADLVAGLKNPESGRDGLSAEVTLRALVLKQMLQLSYTRLEFTLQDSNAYRAFCGIGFAEEGPRRSALHRAFKKIGADTLEKIHWALLEHAKAEGVEHGRKVRFDCTVVESNIHHPTDSSLLWDGVRVLVRLMHSVDEYCSAPFRDRTRVAKRRALAILNAKNETKRNKLYRELMKHTREVIEAAESRTRWLKRNLPADLMASLFVKRVIHELEHYIPLVQQVLTQTGRRVLLGDNVPACDKLVSLFEPHTDVIVKDRRDTYYGHKITLATGPSGLVLDCQVLDGNPADSTLAAELVRRQKDIFDRAPRQVAFDGGFAAKANLAEIKDLGVADVMFKKKRGLNVPDMVKSAWVYKQLAGFRAGIEAGISWLKRIFGLRRCTWRSLRSFKAYAWASVVSANLLVLARHAIKAQALS